MQGVFTDELSPLLVQNIMGSSARASRHHRLMDGLCNIVTTSTSTDVLYALHRHGSLLSGWAWPPQFPGHMSIEDCRPFIFKDEDVKADCCFMSKLLC